MSTNLDCNLIVGNGVDKESEETLTNLLGSSAQKITDSKINSSKPIVIFGHTQDLNIRNQRKQRTRKTVAGLSTEKMADNLAQKVSKDKREELKDIYIIACEAGWEGRDNPCYAKELAQKLHKKGFTNVKVHAVTSTNEHHNENFRGMRVKLVNNPGVNLFSQAGDVSAFAVTPEYENKINQLRQIETQLSNPATKSETQRQLKREKRNLITDLKNLEKKHTFMETGNIIEELNRPENTFTAAASLKDINNESKSLGIENTRLERHRENRKAPFNKERRQQNADESSQQAPENGKKEWVKTQMIELLKNESKYDNIEISAFHREKKNFEVTGYKVKIKADGTNFSFTIPKEKALEVSTLRQCLVDNQLLQGPIQQQRHEPHDVASNPGAQKSNPGAQKSNPGAQKSNLGARKSNLGAQEPNPGVKDSNFSSDNSNIRVQNKLQTRDSTIVNNYNKQIGSTTNRSFHAFKAEYNGLRGDVAKREILREFETAINSGELEKDPQKFVEKFNKLKEGQGITTRVLGLTTDSVKVLNKMINENTSYSSFEDMNERVKKENSSALANSPT